MAHKLSFRTALILCLTLALPLVAAPRKSGERASDPSAAPNSAAPQKAPENAAAVQARPAQLAFEATDLARMINHDSSGLQVRTLANGTMMLDLSGGFRSVLVMQTAPDGKRVVSCIASEKQARKMFDAPSKTQKER